MQALRTSRIQYLALLGAVGALCVLPAGASAAKTASVPIDPNGVGTATAECPEGSRATGGGFRFLALNLGGGAVYENRKVGQRRWRVSVEGSGGQPFTLTALAYCSKRASSTKQRQSPFETNVFAGPVPAIAECDTGNKARAGGFVSGDRALALGFFPGSSVRTNTRSWTVDNAAFGAPARYRSFAYCGQGNTPKARSGSTNSEATDLTALSAACPTGTKPSAGGFSTFNGSFGNFQFINESFRVGKSWRTSSFSGGGPATLTSVAYCS